MTISKYIARTFCTLVVVFASVFAFGEAVYVVNHSSAVISFDVNGDELVFRNELFLPAHGYGGIDLAIDNDYNILFMSSEATNVFEIIDAHTLTHIKSETFNGPGNITGLVYDAAESRILATERNTNILYSILWDPARQELTVEQPYIYLDHIKRACDVAINGDVLYVSEYYYNWSGILPSYEKIYAYDIADDFAYLGTIDLGAPVVSIDYNSADNSIYAGCWQGYDYDYIIKYDIDPNVVITKDISANVVGMSASNSVAGRVFATTARNGGSVEIWDTNDWTSDANEIIEVTDVYDNSNTDGVTLGGLAGLALGSLDLSIWGTSLAGA